MDWTSGTSQKESCYFPDNFRLPFFPAKCRQLVPHRARLTSVATAPIVTKLALVNRSTRNKAGTQSPRSCDTPVWFPQGNSSKATSTRSPHHHVTSITSAIGPCHPITVRLWRSRMENLADISTILQHSGTLSLYDSDLFAQCIRGSWKPSEDAGTGWGWILRYPADRSID